MERDSAQEQYDKMTKTPVHQLVLRLGLPTTVSMLVTSIYNMADTFFVSQLGTSVSGATGVVFALMAIINAFGFMFGHGAGSNISRKLGAHDVESARVFDAMAIAILCSVTVSIPALINGMFNLMFFVNCVDRLIIFGVTSEYCGTNNTSSNVMPSPMIVPISTVSSLSFILMCFVYYLTI